jgi:hypothetical protein
VLQDGSEFFEQVWSIARLLELFYHADYDFIVDALCVDFETAAFWGRSGSYNRRHEASAPRLLIVERGR